MLGYLNRKTDDFMAYNYRCSRTSCRARVTRKRLIETYVIDVYRRCPACGSDSLKIDNSVKRRSSLLRCDCDGYSFPHRRGTEPWCVHARRGPDDSDYRERYGSIY